MSGNNFLFLLGWYREKSRPFVDRAFLFCLKEGVNGMLEQLQTLKSEAETQINEASDLKTLNDLRVKYLGKKAR